MRGTLGVRATVFYTGLHSRHYRSPLIYTPETSTVRAVPEYPE